MLKIIVSILVFASVILALGLAPQAPAGEQDAAKLRVGVYDNRGILMAWFDSEYNDLSELRKELEQATQAGNDERVKELQALGPKLQRRLHFQGFGRAPVTELLAHVEDQLPDLAKELGVDVIVFECNYAGDDVEIVDITLDLVKLFNPSPETIKSVKSVMDHDPVALEDLMDDDR